MLDGALLCYVLLAVLVFYAVLTGAPPSYDLPRVDGEIVHFVDPDTGETVPMRACVPYEGIDPSSVGYVPAEPSK